MSEVRIITAQPPSLGQYIKELAKFRSLIWVFARQELKTMYAQTYFGLLWTVIRPLATLLIFTVIFKLFLKVPTQSPYYLFAFTGMIAWNLFSYITTYASSAVLQKQHLIRKMYFPKLILPLSKIIPGCAEAAISFTILLLFMLFEGAMPGRQLLLAPFFLLLNIICGYAVAVWMNALNIRFRDLNQIVPTIIGIGVWVTPVFYPSTIIPSAYNHFVYINPMAGIIKGYRYALLGEAFPEIQYWFAIVFVLLLAVIGTWYFNKVEDKMVDYA